MHRDPWFFEKITSPKGIELWHKEVPELPWFSVGVIVYAGHRHDPPAYNNLSHFVEHSIIDSEKPHWKTRGAREEYMLEHGIIEAQGFATTVDYMWTSIKTTRATAGLSYLHDIFRIPPIAIETDKPRRIIEREKKERGTDDDRAVAKAIMAATLPEWHPRVRYFDTQSLTKMLETVNHEVMLSHWRTRYTDANTILVSIGSISKAEMVRLVDTYYAVDGDDVARGVREVAGPIARHQMPAPGRVSLYVEQVLGHHNYDKNISPEVSIVHARTLPHLTSAERYMMKRTLNSSLFERLREQKKLIYSAPVRNELYQDVALHKITMNCAKEHIDEILTESEQITDIVREEGRAVFEREKREALLSFELDEETWSAIVHDAMHHIGAHGAVELKIEYMERLRTITFEETLARIDECFGKGNATVLAVIP